MGNPPSYPSSLLLLIACGVTGGHIGHRLWQISAHLCTEICSETTYKRVTERVTDGETSLAPLVTFVDLSISAPLNSPLTKKSWLYECHIVRTQTTFVGEGTFTWSLVVIYYTYQGILLVAEPQVFLSVDILLHFGTLSVQPFLVSLLFVHSNPLWHLTSQHQAIYTPT